MKTAGIVDTALYTPFSALAAAITSPGDQRGRVSAIGALLGAGMASMAQKEYADRLARGEKVSPTDFNPLIQSVLAGLATGGGARVIQDVRGGRGISPMSALMAGVPTGAIIASDDPGYGAGLGAIAGLTASGITHREQQSEPRSRSDLNRVRVEQAIQRSLRRIQALQAWLESTRPTSAAGRFDS